MIELRSRFVDIYNVYSAPFRRHSVPHGGMERRHFTHGRAHHNRCLVKRDGVLLDVLPREILQQVDGPKDDEQGTG